MSTLPTRIFRAAFRSRLSYRYRVGDPVRVLTFDPSTERYRTLAAPHARIVARMPRSGPERVPGYLVTVEQGKPATAVLYVSQDWIV